MATVLVLDDEENIRISLKDILSDEGHDVLLAGGAREGLKLLRAAAVDVLLLDIWLPDRDGVSVLEEVARDFATVKTIMISGHGDIATAVRATKLGAFDFLEKPIAMEKLLHTVGNAIRMRRLELRNMELEKAAGIAMIGDSRAMGELRERIRAAAPTDARVLISGENGTGKELVARSIHEQSPRAPDPFVAVNCAAIPETLIESELFGHEAGAFTDARTRKTGKLEIADRGTVFLDEISDMSLQTQAKVLRALQEMRFERVGGTESVTVNVRVIAATNRDIEKEIAEGRFREDLYYRLNVIPIEVPPLRGRAEDIAPLCRYYLEVFAQGTGTPPKHLADDAETFLRSYRWPGNVRELKNLMERANILVPDRAITGAALRGIMRSPDAAEEPGARGLREAREEFEKRVIRDRLAENGWSVTRTARSLGIERSNLHRKMKAYGIRPAKEADSEKG